MNAPATKPLSICLLQLWDLGSWPSPPDWGQLFPAERFAVQVFETPETFLRQVQDANDNIDALLVLGTEEDWHDLTGIAQQLCLWGVLLPTVLILLSQVATETGSGSGFYHTAVLTRKASLSSFPAYLKPGSQESISIIALIDQAIARFLQFSPTCGVPEGYPSQGLASIPERVHTQQQRLAEKLRERLGYKGIYYHRDPQQFFRNLSESEQQQLVKRLRGLYQSVVLDYFQVPSKANVRMDELVALAFFADMGASQILEIHMVLMDDFAKQLKLEGRNEEILLDYRITLIDVISHLTEMYRRAIPRSPTLPHGDPQF